ncbi:MAG: 5-oxoprolinase subunit PxpA [Gemmatimonadales bacterium]
MIFTRSIDLNADLAEHDGDSFAHDDAILDVVSSASIACGAHAGSPVVMRQTIASAYTKGVSIGAHPGYPDREGFGRRESKLSITAIGDSVAAQIEQLLDCCAAEGAKLVYVKPHGALYNRAMKDAELSAELVKRIAAIDDSLIILTLPKSALARISIVMGLSIAREAFIDRAYLPDGKLVPRSESGAVIHEVDAAASRAVEMARDHRVMAIDGTEIGIDAQSFCVHGDSIHALQTVTEARRRLEAAGFSIETFAR